MSDQTDDLTEVYQAAIRAADDECVLYDIDGDNIRAIVDAVVPLLADRYRAEARREADNAICWDTTCTNCATLLDRLYGEFARGEQAGYRQAVEDIARTLGRKQVDEAVRIAEHLREHGQDPGSTSSSTTAAGFEFARQLRDPALRARLKELGQQPGDPVVAATARSTLGDLLGRIPETGRAVIAILAAAGFRLASIRTEPDNNQGDDHA